MQWDLSARPSELLSGFVGEFLGVEEELLAHGCARPNDTSIRPSGATALLLTWKDLITPCAGTFFPIPPQRVVVRTYLTIKRSFTASDHANQFPFMSNRHLQCIRDHLSSPLHALLGFSPQQLRTVSITYSPLAFLMAISVTKWQLFPKHLFQHWVRLALDLPFEGCSQICEACGAQQDVTGHHRATCSKRASNSWKRGHTHVIDALGAILDLSGMPSTTKEAQIPRHLDTAKHGDILVQCPVGHFPDLVLDFSLIHPRTGSSARLPTGTWKPQALANATHDNHKTAKHAISYEQTNHAFLSLIANTYGQISNDFVRFLWVVATAASTNFRLSQPHSQDGSSQSQDLFTKQRGSVFSRIRVQIGAAIAKVAAARFVPDSADDGLPLPVVWDRPKIPTHIPAPEPDLPLYHTPCS